MVMEATAAPLQLPHVFSDNMILQRDAVVPVWGWATPGEEITVAFGDQQKKAVAGKDGQWRIKLDRMPASEEPREMVVVSRSPAAETGRVKFRNVLVGEVWLCSGQSNMQWTLPMAGNGEQEVAAATDAALRFFAVPQRQSHQPLSDVESGVWRSAVSNDARNVSAVGYFFARELRRELKVPVGLLQAAWGGSSIEPWTTPGGYASVPALAGTDRISPEALKKPPAWLEPHSMYHAMILPLVPYGLCGFLWYQGESNVPDGLKYTDRMKALINGWRQAWNLPELPFYFVQICPYISYANQDLQFLWMAQSRVLAEVPRTGMAITTDLGDLANIHPLNKQEVGRRLALWALAKTYGRDKGLYAGPMYRSKKVEGRKIRIGFDQAQGGLMCTDGQAPGTFEVAGADLEFVPAQAAVEGETVVVWSERVPEPREARFGWTLTPATTLVNRVAIPMLPFRTDGAGVEISFALTRALNLHEASVPAESNRFSIREVVTNPFPAAVTLAYEWRTAGTSWTLEPARGELRLSSGGQAELAAEGTLDRAHPYPLPMVVLRAELEPGKKGVAVCQLKAWFLRLARATRGEPAQADQQSGFGDSQAGLPVAHDTSFRVTYDDKALHVSVTAHDPDAAALVTKIDKRDGFVWTDDSIEVFVLPEKDRAGRYYHFIANSAGVQYDDVGGPGCGMFGDAKWNGQWEVTGRKDKESFSVDFVIPYATLGGSVPTAGTAWYFNVCRNRPPHKPDEKLELSCWSKTAGIYHTPSRFGQLVFQ